MDVVLALHKINNECPQSVAGSPDDATDGGGGFAFTVAGED